MTAANQSALTGDGETKFFYELSPEKILAAVETIGVRCTGRCLALNSMENRVYEVEIDAHDDSELSKLPPAHPQRFRIVKFYRPGRWTQEQILEEHRFLFDLVEYEIPVVAPIKDAAGNSLFRVESVGIWFAIFPKVGGRSPDELTSEQIPQVGRLLARLHGVGKTKQAVHRLRTTGETLGLGALRSLENSGLVPPQQTNELADLVNELCRISKPMIDAAESGFQRIHGDCHLGNLLWGQEGPFWVDFDDMMIGPPVQDLWLILSGRDEHAQQQLRRLLESYEQMQEFNLESLELIEPLRALRMIHFAGWIAKRWEDPAFKRTFTNFATPGYWNELIGSLRDQLHFIENERYFWLR